MRPPSILEHEPPMLLGFSWSEVVTIFFPSSIIWLFSGLLLGITVGDNFQMGLFIGIATYLIGETATFFVIAWWYSKVRRGKPEGWHLHMIATKFHWLGLFKLVCREGKWRC